MFFLDSLLVYAGVLVGVAFFTLLERKILGYVHFRKGPTKVFYFGIFQPISDALKLFSKGFLKGYKMMFYFYARGPLLGLFLTFILWRTYREFFGLFGRNFSLIYIFCFISLGVYFLLFCGWGRGSKYRLLGRYRSISQTISYEVSLIFFGLSFVYLVFFYDLFVLIFFQNTFWFIFFRLIFFLGWLYVCLAESNRTPFDFSEGESELVSGFNVEYGRGLFSLVFICEYGMVIFLSFLRVTFFFGRILLEVKLLFFCFIFVWLRCCLPRYRYDFLMYQAWKTLLPFSMFFLLFVCVCIFKFSRFCSIRGFQGHGRKLTL